MKLINRDQVSTIVTFDFKEGIFHKYKGWITMKYLPYRKHKWYEFDKETLEGYYQAGVNGHFDSYFSPQKVLENSNKFLIKDSQIYTYPHIKIYSSGDLIHTEYFPTFEELENHLKENYPNVNIRYE